MVPLYAARIEDLGPGDFVRVECAVCGHDMLIPPSSLRDGLRLPPYTPLLDLERRLRCRECDAKGRRLCRLGGLRVSPWANVTGLERAIRVNQASGKIGTRSSRGRPT
jgi:hypothetical protein